MTYDVQRDHQTLDLLHASERDAKQAIARSLDLIEETERLLRWARQCDTPLLGLRPLEC